MMNLRFGIRATLYLALGAMLAVVIFVVMAALLATSRVGDSAREIIEDRLPETVETLRVARAVDGVLAASTRVIFMVIDPHRGAGPDQAGDVVGDLASATLDFERASSVANHVPELTSRLLENINRLRDLVARRMQLRDDRSRLRGEMLVNLQAFQEHLTHRVRILQSDGEVVNSLLRRDQPDTPRIARIAGELTASLSIMRFYTEIESIHGRLQSAGQDQSATALDLSRSILRGGLDAASSTYADLPPHVADVVAGPFSRLDALVNSDGGLIALRHAELELFARGHRLLEESRAIGGRIDAATRALVAKRMRGIAQAGHEAALTRQHYVASMMLVALIGLTTLAALMYLQIHRRLVFRLTWLSRAMQQLASGDVHAELPPEGEDEFGRLSSALRQFRATEVAHREQEEELRASNLKTTEALGALEQANRKLSALSTTDPLTGVANRRRFDDALQVEWARAAHAHRPLTLMMIDVDYFKVFNDRFGHQAGDECLQRIAAAIRSRARRASDVVARYGGEEFCVISAYTDPAKSRVLAESIRQAVRDLEICHEDPDLGRVTVSIGYAVVDTVESLHPEDLLHAADKALYVAKHRGRDRVEEGVVQDAVARL